MAHGRSQRSRTRLLPPSPQLPVTMPQLFDGLAGMKIDPEMVQSASQLVERQSGKYDAAELEDRYETRLRATALTKMAGMEKRRSTEQRNTATVGVAA